MHSDRTRKRDSGSDGAVKRLTTTALALVCIIGHLSGFTHFLLVSHVPCLEHGELLHPGEAGAMAPGSPTTTAVGDVAGANSYRAAPGNRSGYGHDHCAVASHRRERFALQCLRTSPVLVARREAPAPTEREGPVAPPVDLILLAPKNSPPA